MSAVLKLRPECASKPTVYDLTRVEVVMHWPDNVLMQEHALSLYFIERGKPLIHRMERAFLIDYATKAADMATATDRRNSVEMVRKSAIINHRKGIMAGIVLQEAIYYDDTGIDWSVKEIISNYNERMEDFHRITEKTYYNSARIFNKASHLWAARHEFWRRHQGTRAESEFPCKVDELAEFLALADFFRRRGEGVRPKYREEPMLSAGEAFTFPGLDLPKVECQRFPQAGNKNQSHT